MLMQGTVFNHRVGADSMSTSNACSSTRLSYTDQILRTLFHFERAFGLYCVKVFIDKHFSHFNIGVFFDSTGSGRYKGH